MTKEEFQVYRKKYAKQIDEIRAAAHELHDSVNQIYGDGLPYGFHLDMVVEAVEEFGHLVCVSEDDMIPLFFGAFFHDTIEDTLQSYNDVMRRARKWMTEEQALMATEIVYALTNDKGLHVLSGQERNTIKVYARYPMPRLSCSVTVCPTSLIVAPLTTADVVKG